MYHQYWKAFLKAEIYLFPKIRPCLEPSRASSQFLEWLIIVQIQSLARVYWDWHDLGNIPLCPLLSISKIYPVLTTSFPHFSCLNSTIENHCSSFFTQYPSKYFICSNLYTHDSVKLHLPRSSPSFASPDTYLVLKPNTHSSSLSLYHSCLPMGTNKSSPSSSGSGFS